MKGISMNKLVRVISIMLIVVGLMVTLYGTYNVIDSKKQVETTLKQWEKTAKLRPNLPAVEKDDLTEIESVPSTVQLDSVENIEAGQLIGQLNINDIDIPLLTGTEEKLLKKGALHYASTPLPAKEGNSVIIGHRDGVFACLEQVEMGDEIVIEAIYGNLVYDVFDIKILNPMDASIFDSYGFSTISLETCYPFSYFGPSPERYVVVGKFRE